MHGLLRCNINACVHARAHGADVSLRDVTIAQIRNGATECEWRHATEARGGFWEFWRKLVQLSPASGGDGWLWLARGGFATGARVLAGGGADGYLSPYVEEPLNSNVIKSFVPELRSRKCFSCFEILCYMYMCYEHSMYITHSHIMTMLQVFDCIESIAIQLCKRISSNLFKIEITYKLFPWKSCMHIHLNVCQQMTGVKLLLLHSNTWND